MEGEQIGPAEAAQLQAVLERGEEEFAAPGGEAYIPIGDHRLVLEYDVDLPVAVADGRGRGREDALTDGGYPISRGLHAFREDDPEGRGFELLPA